MFFFVLARAVVYCIFELEFGWLIYLIMIVEFVFLLAENIQLKINCCLLKSIVSFHCDAFINCLNLTRVYTSSLFRLQRQLMLSNIGGRVEHFPRLARNTIVDLTFTASTLMWLEGGGHSVHAQLTVRFVHVREGDRYLRSALRVWFLER